MEDAGSTVQTARLVIRRVTLDDGKGLQELGKDKESSDGAIYDRRWPTSEEGARQMAEWCAGQKECLAVCLKGDGMLIGFIRFNGIDEQGTLNLGHMFHTKYRGGGYAMEAMRHAVAVAFADPKVTSIIGLNAVDWAGQLTPLIELGFREVGRGKGAFAKDAQGRDIEFVSCRMELTREDWLRRAGGGRPR